MARRTNTYAIRLAVEGGGQVKAELLRTGIRTLGGALAASPRSGGPRRLVDRSISAADAIGKTADTIGVGVEALQELRFAAKAFGVEQQRLQDTPSHLLRALTGGA
jgi:hypothetical protein